MNEILYLFQILFAIIGVTTLLSIVTYFVVFNATKAYYRGKRVVSEETKHLTNNN